MANAEAVSRGYHQVLWLLDGIVTEAGASNFFVVWKSKEGKNQLVTAPLGDKIILDGITRRSILQLARERLSDNNRGVEPLEIVERQYTMDEFAEAVQEGRVVEAFAAGTIVSISTPGSNVLLTVPSTLCLQSPSSATKIKNCRFPWLVAIAASTHI